MAPRDADAGPARGEGTGLTHVDAAGRARMVDVTAKPWTHRRAVARGRVVLAAGAVARTAGLRAGPAWGELLDAARVAGVQAAKRTSELVPLCHSLPSSAVTVTVSPTSEGIDVESRAEVVGPTGIEMEALTACTVTALTLVAALLPHDPEVCVEDVALWEKAGGRSGTWVRRPDD